LPQKPAAQGVEAVSEDSVAPRALAQTPHGRGDRARLPFPT